MRLMVAGSAMNMAQGDDGVGAGACLSLTPRQQARAQEKRRFKGRHGCIVDLIFII